MVEKSSIFPKNWFVPTDFEEGKFEKKHIFHLNWAEILFKTLEDPKASRLSLLISVLMNCAIFLGCISYILASDRASYISEEICHHPACSDDPVNCPGYTVCEPEPGAELEHIEQAILYIFTVEYGLRFLIIWFVNPRLCGYIAEEEEEEGFDKVAKEEEDKIKEQTHPFWKGLKYLTEFKNLIDFATIVPFYVIDSLHGGAGGSFNFIRVLRLMRVLHVFKLTKDNQILHLLERTMLLSAPGFYLFFLFFHAATFFFLPLFLLMIP